MNRKNILNPNILVPQFTVITPTLNSSKYINDCLTSTLNQNAVSIEHIVVDGGSVDETKEIVKKYPHASFYELPGSNIYEALNHGIKVSSGKVICFLNSDDYYYSNDTLSNVERNFLGSTADIAYGGCIMVNAHGKYLYQLKPINRFKLNFAPILIFVISHPATFFKRRIFLDYGLYDASLKFSSDCDYILRCLKLGLNFKILNFPIANFRRHNLNASSNPNAQGDIRLILTNYAGWCPYPIHRLFFLLSNIFNFAYIKFLIIRFLNTSLLVTRGRR